ncbi:MAG: deoxynucleoside kinase [Flavobacteriales bacterium]|jgi:deoxyadenosine/deoxycytidine kinase|nr:deoxynucleoside kinase [Flavobacteriales bacterium]MBK7943668.1 deoxynucleoside kinase [Flavobacteriales bacterium]MBK9699648.1 deoxynucleoside kinase [Flavobacteriales bacterium]
MHHGYIALEGLIGAGKTTLARRLAERWGARLVLEEFDDNPFLPRFYADPQRYAFAVELSFLAQRYHQLKRASEQDLFAPRTVADYSIGKSLVFASATLNPEENTLFRDLYRIMFGSLPRPDLIVYLHLPLERVRDRIRERGRSYEQDIRPDYLERLRELYMDHLQKTDGSQVLVVDLGGHDLLRDQGAYEALCTRLEGPQVKPFDVVQL